VADDVVNEVLVVEVDPDARDRVVRVEGEEEDLSALEEPVLDLDMEATQALT